MEKAIVSVKYVGPATVKRLAEHGITRVEQLAGMSVAELTAVPGIGAGLAPRIIASAQELVSAPVQKPKTGTAVTEAKPEAEAGKPEVAAEEKQKLGKKTKKAAEKAKKKAKELKKEAKKVAAKAEKKAQKKAQKLKKETRKAADKAKKKSKKKQTEKSKKSKKK